MREPLPRQGCPAGCLNPDFLSIVTSVVFRKHDIAGSCGELHAAVRLPIALAQGLSNHTRGTGSGKPPRRECCPSVQPKRPDGSRAVSCPSRFGRGRDGIARPLSRLGARSRHPLRAGPSWRFRGPPCGFSSFCPSCRLGRFGRPIRKERLAHPPMAPPRGALPLN